MHSVRETAGTPTETSSPGDRNGVTAGKVGAIEDDE